MKIKIFFLIFSSVCLIFFSRDLYSQPEKILSIDEVIKISIDNNQTVRSARLNIEKENSIKLRSFNIPDPEVFIEYEGVKGSLSNAESRKIGITQEIEFPLNYFLRSDVQSSQIKAAQEELNNSINNLKAEIKSDYLRMLLLIELLRNSKENFKIYEEFYFIAEKKYDAGSTSNLEVLGSKVSLIKFENQIKNLESEIKTVQSEIRYLMNADYNIIPAGELSFKEMNLNRTDLKILAVNNNPELKILKYRKEKSSNKISLSKSELYPDISLKYFRQKTGNDNNQWGMEIGLGIPLWFWSDATGKIQESNYEYKIASGDELNLKKSLENETDRTFEDYENNLRQLKFFNEHAVKETDEILRQSKKSYDEGEIGYVEYLNALNLVYDTKTQYLNSIYNYNQSIIKMEKLTAGELK